MALAQDRGPEGACRVRVIDAGGTIWGTEMHRDSVLDLCLGPCIALHDILCACLRDRLSCSMSVCEWVNDAPRT